ncbi:MAG: hypothetical protein E6G30_01205 [Actinobacteria bacterium]|nr:MAG: hypothetical protein E6G30_01205 [Actinomycetota bacterium]
MAGTVDVACVVHLHSVHSDGTGTVDQIAAAARRAGVDVVLLTDHDTLEARRRGEEGWHGPVLVCVGTEVSPLGHDHYLAFGLERVVDHRGLSPAGIVEAVAEGGGFGFLAHPFSRGSARFGRPGMSWRDLDCEGYTGIEVWSFVTDTAERLGSLREAAAFVAFPQRVVDHPPRENLAEWDRLGASRRVVGIGGLDAHQLGLRIAGRVPLRLMAYRRSFSFLRTHVLLERPFTGDPDRDRDAVYAALRAGRCYLAMDRLAPAEGFAFGGDGVAMGEEAPARRLELRARLPRTADVELLRDGRSIARAHGKELVHQVEEPGVYRVAATLPAYGRARTWILSNPVYLR